MVVHKIVTSDDVSYLHWTQESMENKNRYDEYMRVVRNILIKVLVVSTKQYRNLPTFPNVLFQMKDAEAGCMLSTAPLSKDSSDQPMESFRSIKIYSHLNFLLIGLRTAEIQVHVFGLFCCGVIDVKKHLPPDTECKIVSAEITQNLKSLVVLAGVLRNETYSLECIVINTNELAQRSQDLYTISYKRGTILNTINNIESSMVSIVEAHEHIVIQEMQMQIFEYSKDKEKGTLSAEFMELLLFGFYSPELATFLRSDLSDKKLKKISSSIEVSHSNILKQIVFYLRPNIERLLFELSTMLGLSRLSRIFSSSKIIIEEELIHKCMIAAAAFTIKANKVLHVLEDSAFKYKSFFRWLASTTVIITNERIGNPLEINQREMNFICDYLCQIDSSTPTSEKDELAQYLGDKDVLLEDDEQNRMNLWRKFLTENPCLEEYEMVIPRSFDNKSLVQIQKYLLESADSIFKNFVEYIKQDFPLNYRWNLFTGETSPKKVSIIEVPKTQKMLIAFMKLQDDEQKLEIVEIPQTISVTEPPRASIYFQDSDFDKFSLIDVQFYTNEVVSLLLDKHDCMHSCHVQLPVENVQNFYNTEPQSIFSVIDKDCLKTIENMKSLKFAVSGPRKVSVIVAEDGHRVRIFEMEADDEDENAMSANNVSNEEPNISTKMSSNDFSEDEYMCSNYESDIKVEPSTNIVDESYDKVLLESGVIDFGDIDVNSLTILSDFADVDDLKDQDISSLDVGLEKNIAELVITSDNSRSTMNVD